MGGEHMIIDVHCHMGWDFSFDEEFKKESLIKKLELVDIQIVQPGTTHNIEDARRQHDDIAALCREYPGRFYGMAAPNPHLPAGQYEDEIARCVKELKFIAIKMHTYAAAVHPNGKAGRRAFETALKHGIPVMVHTGSGMPFASPINLINPAKAFPEVKIIMAHLGTMLLADEVDFAFEQCANIYGDTSWTAGYLLRRYIRGFGDRLMLASDLADNLQTEIAKIGSIDLTADEQDAVMFGTAKKVFKI
jgi:predicted TIM-barrel fold metal-dependent hydrolase